MYIPEIRQILSFLAVEELRSFTAAAIKLDVTQSAISHSIKSLESNLDCHLIERLGKKCILTPQGEVFLHHVRRAMNELESANTKIHLLKKWDYSAVKLGLSHTLCHHVLPEALKEFHRKCSHCEVFITPGDTAVLIEKLEKGQLDVAFGIYRQKFDSGYRFVPIAFDELCFITSPNHPWCQTPPRSEQDFSIQRYITYSKDSLTSQILDDHFSDIGLQKRAVLTMGNMEAIKEMTIQELGVGIVAQWVAREAVCSGELVLHPITPPPRRQWGYYLSKTKILSPPEERLLEIISRVLSRVALVDD